MLLFVCLWFACMCMCSGFHDTHRHPNLVRIPNLDLPRLPVDQEKIPVEASIRRWARADVGVDILAATLGTTAPSSCQFSSPGDDHARHLRVLGPSPFPIPIVAPLPLSWDVHPEPVDEFAPAVEDVEITVRVWLVRKFLFSSA